MGPSALRLAGLNARLESLGYTIEDLGNVSVAQQESTPTGPETAKYLFPIAKTLRETSDDAGVRPRSRQISARARRRSFHRCRDRLCCLASLSKAAAKKSASSGSTPTPT